MYSLWTILVALIILVAQVLCVYDENAEVQKREVTPEWEDLGWAWGKRSDPTLHIPRRLLRAVHAIKKNPDWHDLGWTWGRRK